MRELRRLVAGQSGGSKLALALAVAVVGYLALAGSWATAMFESIDRLASRLPL